MRLAGRGILCIPERIGARMNIIDLSDEPEHITTLAEWHHAEWAHLNPGDILEQRIERMKGYLVNDLVPSTFVCKYQGQLAGSAAIIVSDMDSRPAVTPWLASVYVSPPFRRQGMGSALVCHVMSRAKQAGISDLYLFTPDREAFYRRLGWTTIAEEDYRDCRVTVMQAHLLGEPV